MSILQMKKLRHRKIKQIAGSQQLGSGRDGFEPRQPVSWPHDWLDLGSLKEAGFGERREMKPSSLRLGVALRGHRTGTQKTQGQNSGNFLLHGARLLCLSVLLWKVG